MRNNGETNPGTYVVGALLLAGGFYVFHVAPVYWGNLEAKEAASQAFSVYILNGEEAARNDVLFRLNNNKDVTHLEMNDEGVEEEKPGYGIADDNVKITYDQGTKKLTVRVEYDRIIEFKPLKKRKKFHLVAEKTGTAK